MCNVSGAIWRMTMRVIWKSFLLLLPIVFYSAIRSNQEEAISISIEPKEAYIENRGFVETMLGQEQIGIREIGTRYLSLIYLSGYCFSRCRTRSAIANKQLTEKLNQENGKNGTTWRFGRPFLGHGISLCPESPYGFPRKGFTMRTPSISCPCCMSSENRALQPDCLAVCITKASQKEKPRRR